ncbi:hypothetical protein PybrP1_010170 [[Pythium] brassicae (nom. inval.)]|nr:hypothetical protein PybrP1_010170 [[Pythium] brassicae (nom. inval.)]
MATPPTRHKEIHREHHGAGPVLVEPPGAIASPKLDGAGLHIGIVYTRQSAEVVDALVTACRAELLLKGVERPNLHELQVSLPFELPYALKRLLESAPVALDAVVVIGCLVKGATLAFEFVAEAVTRASLKIGMKMRTPVVYGVLVCTDEQQARACAGLSDEGKTRTCSYGVEWAQSAIEMAHMNLEAAQSMVASCTCECHCASGGACACSSGAQESETTAASKAPAAGKGAGKKGECGACGCVYRK